MKILFLHNIDKNHPGVSAAVSASHCEAGAVCFNRHQSSPPSLMTVIFEASEISTEIHWTPPEKKSIKAWANESDTTEAGAYGVALILIESLAGYVAVRRADHKSGADYYIGFDGASGDDLENCLRLEVSGVNLGDKGVVRQRVRKKLEQARKGISSLPAIAVVVGFKAAFAEVAHLKEQK